jgi:hypothetical protein
MSENLDRLTNSLMDAVEAEVDRLRSVEREHAGCGPELDRLRADVTGWKDTYARDRALWSEGFEHDQRRAESAEAERDVLRERLAKVEAECDAAEEFPPHVVATEHIRAALASVPEPSDSEPRPEAFVELLPPDVGHNLWHFGPERAHVTGDACHCRPRPIPHEPAPDADREAAVVLDAETLTPQGVLIPCPSSAIAILGVPGPVRVSCGHLRGHDGDHEFRVMWGAS